MTHNGAKSYIATCLILHFILLLLYKGMKKCSETHTAPPTNFTDRAF